jgi:hypothetical protein
MERRELWRQWSIAKAKRKAIAVTPEQVGFIYHPLEEFTKINPDASLALKAPLPGQTSLDRGKADGGGEGYPPADPAPPADNQAVEGRNQTSLGPISLLEKGMGDVPN